MGCKAAEIDDNKSRKMKRVAGIFLQLTSNWRPLLKWIQTKQLESFQFIPSTIVLHLHQNVK